MLRQILRSGIGLLADVERRVQGDSRFHCGPRLVDALLRLCLVLGEPRQVTQGDALVVQPGLEAGVAVEDDVHALHGAFDVAAAEEGDGPVGAYVGSPASLDQAAS